MCGREEGDRPYGEKSERDEQGEARKSETLVAADYPHTHTPEHARVHLHTHTHAHTRARRKCARTQTQGTRKLDRRGGGGGGDGAVVTDGERRGKCQLIGRHEI